MGIPYCVPNIMNSVYRPIAINVASTLTECQVSSVR